MNNRRWLQVGGAAGVLSVVLQFGFSLAGGTSEPAFDAPSRDWLAQYQSLHHLFLLAPYLSGLPMLCFLFFVGALHLTLRDSPSDESLPSIAVLLFGGVAATLLLIAISAGAAAVLRVGHGLDESGASTLSGLANEFFVTSWISLGGLLLAAGLGAISSHGLPTWLGWSGIVIGLGLVVAPAAQLTGVGFVPFVLYYLWVAVAGGVIIKQPRSKQQPA